MGYPTEDRGMVEHKDGSLAALQEQLDRRENDLREVAERESRYRDLLLEAGDEIKRLRGRVSELEGGSHAPEGGHDTAELRKTVELQRQTILEMRTQLRDQIREANEHEKRKAEVEDLRRQLEESERLRERQKRAISVVDQVNSSREAELGELRGKAEQAVARAAALEEERDALRERVAETEESRQLVHALESKVAELEGESSLAEVDRAALQEQLDAAGQEIERLKGADARAHELAQREGELSSQVARLERDLEAARRESAELATVRDDLLETSDRLFETEKERDGLRGQVAELASSAEALREQGEARGEELAEARARIDLIEGELGEAKRLRAELEDQGRSLAEQVSALESERDRERARVVELEESLQAKVEAVEAAGVALEETRSRVAALESELESSRSEGEAAAGLLEQARARLGQLERQLAEQGERIAALSDQSAALAEERNGAQARCAELEAEVGAIGEDLKKESELREALAGQLEKAQAEAADVGSRLADAESLAGELEVRRTALAEEVERLEGGRQRDQDVRRALEQEIGELRGLEHKYQELVRSEGGGSISLVRAQLEEERAERGDLESRLAAVTLERDELRARIDASGAETASDGAGRIAELEQALETARRELAEARSEAPPRFGLASLVGSGETAIPGDRERRIASELESLRSSRRAAEPEPPRRAARNGRTAEPAVAVGDPDPDKEDPGEQPGDRLVRELRESLGDLE
jgi:chromosome segregation ATPase